MRCSPFLVPLLVLAACAAPSQPDAAPGGAFPTPQIPFAPRGYRAPYLPPDVFLEIDGKLDDEAWRDVPWTEMYADISGPGHATPRFRTRGKMAWDEDAFYFAAELEEPHLWATYTERDSVIFHENDWEIFVDPDGDTHDYYELEINARGTVWDLFLVKPYRDGGPALHAWDAPGLRTAVHVNGTLNDGSDVDRGWSVEVAWPWTAFDGAAGARRPPRPGDRWRVNFSRVQWHVHAGPFTVEGHYPPAVLNISYVKQDDPETGKRLPEDNWVWSPQGLVDMHYPEMWGIVEFVAAGTDGPLPEPTPEDLVRWQLREAYYAQRGFRSTHQRWARSVEELSLSKTHPRLRVQTTDTTFEMRLPAPEGGDVVIREDGHVFRAGAER